MQLLHVDLSRSRWCFQWRLALVAWPPPMDPISASFVRHPRLTWWLSSISPTAQLTRIIKSCWQLSLWKPLSFFDYWIPSALFPPCPRGPLWQVWKSIAIVFSRKKKISSLISRLDVAQKHHRGRKKGNFYFYLRGMRNFLFGPSALAPGRVEGVTSLPLLSEFGLMERTAGL